MGGRAGGARRPAARLGEPAGSLWARLTERDRRILHLVSDHRVLTTDQLTVLEFGSRTRAQHRLQELHEMDVLWRFRSPAPQAASIRGTTPSATPAPGCSPPRKPCDRPARPNTHSIWSGSWNPRSCDTSWASTTSSSRWPTTPASNADPTRTSPACARLDTWRSEAWITAHHDGQLRPDGFGCWAENDRLARFYLECDTGTETLDRVAGKLEDYHCAGSRVTYPVFG